MVDRSFTCIGVAKSQKPIAFDLMGATDSPVAAAPASRAHSLFGSAGLERAYDAQLTGIRFFLKKTWGSSNLDEGLAEYDYLTTHQPGAQHAPYYFVSGFLFSSDIPQVYLSLTLPVWMTHGVRGDFTDYTQKKRVAGRANWRIDVMETGAMPHFELRDAFIAGYDDFLAGVSPANAP